MNSYVRDDGVVMVETRPGCFTRRDSLSLLDLAPLARRAVAAIAADVTGLGVTPPPTAPTHEDLAPGPVEAPPLQPSFADLVAGHAADHAATSHAGFAEAYAAETVVTVGLPAAKAPALAPPRAPRPKPVKRSIAAILAEADRSHRARKSKR